MTTSIPFAPDRLEIRIEENPDRGLARIRISSSHPEKPSDHALAAAHLGVAIGLLKNVDGFAVYASDGKYAAASIGIEGRGHGPAEFRRIMFLARTIVDRLKTVEIPE